MLIWIALLGLIVWAIASAARSAPRVAGGSARAILDERLAKGELSVEEYRKLRAEI